MKPRSSVRVLLVIGAGLVTAVAWFLHLQSVRLEQRVHLLADQVSRTTDQELALQRQTRSNREQLDGLKAEAEYQAARSAKPKPELSDFDAAWLGDPTAQAKSLRYTQVHAAVIYNSLFRRLGLTAAQIQAFLDHLQEREGAMMDLRSTRLELGLGESDSAVSAEAAQIKQNYNSAQSALLGIDGFNQLTAFDENWTRMLANDVIGGAVTAGLSFSPAQTQALAAAFAQASTNDAGMDWSRVDQEAATFLNPEQLSYLKSAEFLGALGSGSRYLEMLNRLITKGDATDQAAAAKP